MSKALDLATFVIGDLATTTDVTDAINGIVIPDGGKVLQVDRTGLPSLTSSTSSTYATLLTSNSITLDSASNSLLVDVDLAMEVRGNSATVTPEANVELRDSLGNVLDSRIIYHAVLAGSNDSRLTFTTRLQALYSPATTTETVSVFFKCDQGRLDAQDTSSITITEIAA